MESPNRQYLPAVDHLRAFAALLILFYHCCHLFYPRIALHRAWQPTDWIHTGNLLLAPIIEGHTAVSLFLVVSGFILTLGSLGGSIRYSDFFRNRFLRLFPMYLVILLVGANAFRTQFSLSGLLTSILQFGYLAGGLSYGAWTGVTWSVSVESQLYLLFPVFRYFLSAGRLWPLLRIAVIVWLARLAALALGADVLDLTYWTALARVDQFLAGAILAWLVHRFGLPAKVSLLFPIAFAAVVAALWSFHLSGGFWAKQQWRIAWPTAEAILWSAFTAGYLAFARFVPRLLDLGLRFVGRVSYSVYLVHVIVIWIFAERGWYFDLPGLGIFGNIFLTASVLVLPVVLAISAMTYAAIEQPFLSMRRRYADQLSKAA
jgi:peptidoglycan/LPS O-acetylase OafA/YrhL